MATRTAAIKIDVKNTTEAEAKIWVLIRGSLQQGEPLTSHTYGAEGAHGEKNMLFNASTRTA